LQFVTKIYQNKLCTDEEYKELVEILIATNDRLTLDLSQIRNDFYDPYIKLETSILKDTLKLESWLAAIVCGKFIKEFDDHCALYRC
jgi:hypothetical protein